MDATTGRTPRRTESLSRQRIIDAAVGILDADHSAGERGLTLRALTAELSTGSGAIYHHVANMAELREAAADTLLRDRIDRISDAVEPGEALRTIGFEIFETIRAHPWIAVQLTQSPLQPAVIRIWKSIGIQLARLGLGDAEAANAGSTLTSFILGSAVQWMSGAARVSGARERGASLEEFAKAWVETDDHPAVEGIASQLRAHDDVDQFRAGLEIILRGIDCS